MKIWITRHGQTRLNKARRMQGQIDEPLNKTGVMQAKEARKRIGRVTFDAVYASPLKRAIITGAYVGGVRPEKVIVDDRLIEVDFGRYEMKKYYLLGPAMSLYWACPELMPCPKTVEPVASMVERSSSFLREIENMDYENVLISCHGGIMRALCGYMMDRPNGICWRPKPKNCEIRVFDGHGEYTRIL